MEYGWYYSDGWYYSKHTFGNDLQIVCIITGQRLLNFVVRTKKNFKTMKRVENSNLQHWHKNIAAGLMVPFLRGD
jgi:hypothetical protein